MTELIEAMPKSWQEVTLGQWRDICLIKEEDENERTIQTLSILLECSESQIRDLSLVEWKELLESATFVKTKIYDGITTTFTIDDKEYGMIPKLDAKFISAGEFLDIEQWKKASTENIHLITALIYRPVIYKGEVDYAIEPYTREGFFQRANLFLEKLPITKVYSAVVFFSAFAMEYIQILADYLEAEGMAQKRSMKKRQKVSKKHKQEGTTKNGDGII